MMDQAEAAGLRFLPDARERFAPPPDRSAPLHDSRKGLSGYYRYQPRRLDAYLRPPLPSNRLMVDPRPAALAQLRTVVLHESVLQRIRQPGSRYAPIVLPAEVAFVGNDGKPVDGPSGPDPARAAGQEAVWDDVWQKRVTYGATAAASFALATMPFWASSAEAGACVAFYCSVGPLIHLVATFIPSAAGLWTDAFATHAGTALVLAAVIAALLGRSAYLQQRIRDRMLPLLDGFRGRAVTVTPPPAGAIRHVRTSRAYLAFAAWLKWDVAQGWQNDAGPGWTAGLLRFRSARDGGYPRQTVPARDRRTLVSTVRNHHRTGRGEDRPAARVHGPRQSFRGATAAEPVGDGVRLGQRRTVPVLRDMDGPV